MPSANWPLQQALFAKLTGDASLLASLGGPRVYDDVPQGADFPYLTFAQSTLRDWSTATESGEEHVVTLRLRTERRLSEEEIKALLNGLYCLMAEAPDALGKSAKAPRKSKRGRRSTERSVSEQLG